MISKEERLKFLNTTENQLLETHQLISSIKMSEIVQNFVAITQVGENFLTDCIFCQSSKCFAVSNKNDLCKCFQCNKSWNKVEFIMSAKGIEFNQIADYLKSIIINQYE
jgi:DNA primase